MHYLQMSGSWRLAILTPQSYTCCTWCSMTHPITQELIMILSQLSIKALAWSTMWYSITIWLDLKWTLDVTLTPTVTMTYYCCIMQMLCAIWSDTSNLSLSLPSHCDSYSPGLTTVSFLGSPLNSVLTSCSWQTVGYGSLTTIFSVFVLCLQSQ